MKRALLLAILPMLPILSGCAAVTNLSADGGPKVYGGTQTDWALISGEDAADEAPDGRKVAGPVRAGAACCGLVDLPFSVVADTVMLPITVPQAARHKRPTAEHPRDFVLQKDIDDAVEDPFSGETRANSPAP